MSDTPFSLLMPVYRGDRPEFLRSAFESSVDQQTRPPSQVVIVRDGPVSEVLEAEISRLAQASRVPVTRVDLPENHGLGALSAGLDACEHEVVARMDADDISFPERFARQLALVDEGYDLVGSGLVEFEDGDMDLGRARVTPHGDQISQGAHFRSPFNHPTVVFRQPAVRAAGGYQPMGLMEDYWLWVRMIDGGARTENIPEPLVAYRVDRGAYRRRGGLEQLRTEIALQRAFRSIGFTTRRQLVRNVLVRGGYRLTPTFMRRGAYRRAFTSD